MRPPVLILAARDTRENNVVGHRYGLILLPGMGGVLGVCFAGFDNVDITERVKGPPIFVPGATR